VEGLGQSPLEVEGLGTELPSGVQGQSPGGGPRGKPEAEKLSKFT